MADKWEKIADNAVRHIWKKSDGDDCGEGPKTIEISPSWYDGNGTPICFCGEDMEYSHTEINLPD